jgi:hypothetical protein
VLAEWVAFVLLYLSESLVAESFSYVLAGRVALVLEATAESFAWVLVYGI